MVLWVAVLLTLAAAELGEDAADDTVAATEDTALPAVRFAAGPWEGPPGVGPWEGPPGAGPWDGPPGRAGSCAAAAGRAKIRARIKASTKIAARPPQAYRHTRRVQTRTFDRLVHDTFNRPTQERMAKFLSTAWSLGRLSATRQ